MERALKQTSTTQRRVFSISEARNNDEVLARHHLFPKAQNVLERLTGLCISTHSAMLIPAS